MMELHLLVPIGLAVIMSLVLWRRLFAKTGGPHSPPEPPGAFPILGHLPLLGGDKHIFRSVTELAEKYGAVFTLRMGMTRVVMVSSRDAATECFTVADKAFVDRPQSSTGKYLAYDSASFGFANGPYWREMRKMVTVEILSTRRLDAMKNLRVSEITESIRELYSETGGEPRKVEISRWAEQVTLNIIMKTIAGKRYGHGGDIEEVETFRKQIKEFTFLAGEFVLSDVIPIPLLRWIVPQNYVKRMKRVSKELDVIVEKCIEEHILRRKEEKPEQEDFIDVMLSATDDASKFAIKGAVKPPSRRRIIKATVVNVILGGFDTTSVFIVWVLSLLLNHRDVLGRAQKEIDDKIGKERWVEESDTLPYLQAIVKETLRLYPPLPLSIPRVAVEDCRVAGYLIPKGTQLFVNLWKIQRDPKYWEEPERFLPERWLQGSAAEKEVMGRNFEYAPFGGGRRSCPGSSFALQVTTLLIGRLIQGFSFGGEEDEVDMEEGRGITMTKANPLQIVITPRLNPSLYA